MFWHPSVKKRVFSSHLSWPNKLLRSPVATSAKPFWCARPAGCSSKLSQNVSIIISPRRHHKYGKSTKSICLFSLCYSFPGIHSQWTKMSRQQTGRSTSERLLMPSSASKALRGRRGKEKRFSCFWWRFKEHWSVLCGCFNAKSTSVSVPGCWKFEPDCTSCWLTASLLTSSWRYLYYVSSPILSVETLWSDV